MDYFKENCPDTRNSKVFDLINHLKKLGFEVDVFDPWIEDNDFKNNNSFRLLSSLGNNIYNVILNAVAHNHFKNIPLSDYKKMLKKE